MMVGGRWDLLSAVHGVYVRLLYKSVPVYDSIDFKVRLRDVETQNYATSH